MTPTRRGFLESLTNVLLGSGAVSLLGTLLYPVVRFVSPPPVPESEAGNVVAAKLADLPLNSGKVFRFGTRPAIVVHTPAGQLRAFSAVCTHLQCIVQYREDIERIWCACHNGHFDLAGRNVAGPPPRPLEEYEVSVRGDDVVVARKT
jgi:cytochrome b6-f complex iron-sulfur subunit